MELIAALAVAGPLGFLARTRWSGLALYLLVWAVIFPIQTIVVHNENADDINWAYPLVNAVILAGGVALNLLGAQLRSRRRGQQRSRQPVRQVK